MPRNAAVVRCEWFSLGQALARFASYTGRTESQAHIKPLHWYTSCRLVLEGGFHPDEIVPRPPFVVRPRRGELHLEYKPESAGGGERTVLGGLKTKNIDVVVVKEGVGPVLAVSCKGAIGAFRNLTNRMEEAVGDCTNLHISYPPMVCGYLFVARANRIVQAAAADIAGGSATPARAIAPNDLAFTPQGEVVDGLIRFHAALRALSGRVGIRDDVSRYEAVALALVETGDPHAGTILKEFPPEGSSLGFDKFFPALYAHYDERYVYGAPSLRTTTARRHWAEASPALSPDQSSAACLAQLDFLPRTGG